MSKGFEMDASVLMLDFHLQVPCLQIISVMPQQRFPHSIQSRLHLMTWPTSPCPLSALSRRWHLPPRLTGESLTTYTPSPRGRIQRSPPLLRCAHPYSQQFLIWEKIISGLSTKP